MTVKASEVLDSSKFLAGGEGFGAFAAQTFLDHAIDAFILLDEALNVVDVNRHACESLGYTREELIGKHPREFDAGLDEISIERMNERIRAGEMSTFETRHRRKDGTVFPVEIRARLFEQGGRRFGVNVVRDISERKQAEEERLAHLWFLGSLDRVNRAMQGANDVKDMMSAVLEAVRDIFGCDRAWLLHPCDPSAPSYRVVMERTRAEFPGAYARGIETSLSADFATVVAAAISAARESDAAVPSGPGYALGIPDAIAERFNIKSRLMTAVYPKIGEPYLFGLHQCSRARVWTQHEQRLFQEIGRRLGDAITSGLTLRNLRESEHRLDEAQRIAHVGYWDRDLETGQMMLSDEGCRIFGLDPQARLLDLAQWHEKWLNLIHPEDRPSVAEAATAALQGGPAYDVEYRVIRSGGDVRIIHSRGEVRGDASGRPTHMFGTMQDITELRRAEEEQRASEALFRVFVDHASDAFILFDEQFRVVDANRRACEALGYSHQELVALRPADFAAYADEAALAQLKARALAGEVPIWETQHIRKDGTTFPVEVRGRVFEHGGNRYYVTTARDIAERKRAEEEQHASETRFRTFVDHATDAFFLLDDQFTVLDVNRRACESLGYSREELIGMRSPDFDPSVTEQDLAHLRELSIAGETPTFESVHRRKDGTLFPVEVRGRVFEQRGRRYMTTARDITERKRADQRSLAHHSVTRVIAEAASYEEAVPKLLQSVCECLQGDLCALWRVDRESGLLRCADLWLGPAVEAPRYQAVTRGTTFAIGNGLPGRVWQTRAPLWVPDTAGVVEFPFPRASVALEEGLHGALAFPVLLGSEVLGAIECLSRAKRTPDPDLLDTMATIGSQIGQFIERKRAESALQRAQAELAHASRVMTLGQLTASIAHEVNQPLGAMVTSAAACTRWLATEPPDMEKAHRALERIVKDGRRAGAVIERIRALVKRQPSRSEWLDLNESVLEVLAMAQYDLRRNEIVVRRLAERLPAVRGDKVQLQQVLLNLVINSIEAMSKVEDRPRELTIVSAADGPKAVLIEVQDSGTGLEADSTTRLFEPFYTTKANGLGIGLSISRSIVESHGGRLSAGGRTPHGAIFRLTLPLEATAP